MLRLERYSVPETIDSACFPGDAAVEKIAGIELQPWLGCENVQRSSRRRLRDMRREHQRIGGRSSAVENEVVIVAVAIPNLRVLTLVNARSDGFSGPKV
jgi:hypothetical protein